METTRIKAGGVEQPAESLRDATPADFGAILTLNEESVAFLSPLTTERLLELHAGAAYHRVAVDGDAVIGFLLALREGSGYDSLNYRWFAARHERFLYVDRVVVRGSRQGRGIGRLFYADLLAHARQTGAGLVTCEYDLEPPNEASRRFHERFGFREVGRQLVAGGGKLVSLQALAVVPNRALEDVPTSATREGGT